MGKLTQEVSRASMNTSLSLACGALRDPERLKTTGQGAETGKAMPDTGRAYAFWVKTTRIFQVLNAGGHQLALPPTGLP